MRGKLQMIYYLKKNFCHFYVPFGFRHYLGVLFPNKLNMMFIILPTLSSLKKFILILVGQHEPSPYWSVPVWGSWDSVYTEGTIQRKPRLGLQFWGLEPWLCMHILFCRMRLIKSAYRMIARLKWANMWVIHKMPCKCRTVLTNYQYRDWLEGRIPFVQFIDPDSDRRPWLWSKLILHQLSPLSRGPGTLAWISSHNNSDHFLRPVNWQYIWLFHTLRSTTNYKYLLRNWHRIGTAR